MTRIITALALVLMTVLAWQVVPCKAGHPVQWKRIQLDPTFRSEGVAAADVNRDGKVDVLAGDVWYESPDWSMHEIRTVGEYQFDKGYSQSFANFSHDINRDGWPDFIVIGFPGAPAHWYENPQGADRHWTEYEIWQEASNESPNFGDLTGDGHPELMMGSDSQMGFLTLPAIAKATQKWKFHPVCEPGDSKTNGTFKYYHGLGHGDLNGDGRNDMLIAHGWFEAPADLAAGQWKFHPYSLTQKPGEDPLRMANIFTYDLDLDGDQDLVASCAHSFGIWWFENLGSENHTQFKYHLIDESFSQTHALQLADVDRDGDLDLITGKRYFAHNGGDPGGQDAVVMYWIEVDCKKGQAPKFTLHEIKAGLNTGVGTQFTVHDVNGDDRIDIVLSNKKGVNLLIQE